MISINESEFMFNTGVYEHNFRWHSVKTTTRCKATFWYLSVSIPICKVLLSLHLSCASICVWSTSAFFNYNVNSRGWILICIYVAYRFLRRAIHMYHTCIWPIHKANPTNYVHISATQKETHASRSYELMEAQA